MHILVTGASRGIGYELVKKFFSSGNHCIYAVARNADRLNALEKECRKLNSSGRVHGIKADLTNSEDILSIKEFIESNSDSLDVLINNAGYLYSERFINFPEVEMEKIFSTNFFAVVKLSQMLIPFLEKSKHAHMVNISSMGGYQGSSKFSGLSMYSASKGALAILTESLAAELKDKKISVNCLSLGAVQTEMLEEAFPGYNAPVSAQEMAGFIVDFALTGHHYFNGKILPVNLSNP